MIFLSNARTVWPAQSARFNFRKRHQKYSTWYLESRNNLIRMMQEIPLTDDEQADVEVGIEAMEKMVIKLKNVTTPDEK